MPLQILRQEITKIKADAVVIPVGTDVTEQTAANKALIKEDECSNRLSCQVPFPFETGKPKIIKAQDLYCHYRIYAPLSDFREGFCDESAILKSCYIESLKLALEYECESVAFPLILSGTYGYPKDKVLGFAISVITEFLMENEMTVYLCVYDRESYEFSKKLFSEIKEFIGDDYADVRSRSILSPISENDDIICSQKHKRVINEQTVFKSLMPTPPVMAESIKGDTLDEYMKDIDKPFAYKLFDLIDEKGMTDVECYKKANVDKKTFSKIKCNPKTYKPSKQTAVAFAIALGLNLEQTQELLASAGMTLSNSFTFDKIIRFFIQKGNYNVYEINEALFEFDQVLLGC